MLRSVLASAARRASTRAAPASRRGLGGSSHGHAHGPKSEPRMFGEPENRVREDVEFPILFFVFFGVVAGIYGLNQVPDTSAATWGRKEALERQRRREEGLPVEYGRFYADEKEKEAVAQALASMKGR